MPWRSTAPPKYTRNTPEIPAPAADTGGIDGGEGKPTDAADAIIDALDAHRCPSMPSDATTLAGARHLDAKNVLHNNDATSFFEAAGGLLVRGRSHQRP